MRANIAFVIALSLGGCSAKPAWHVPDCEPTPVCDLDGCNLIVDIIVGPVSGTLTYDGMPFPESDEQVATLDFSQHGGDIHDVGVPVSGGSGEWNAVLKKGTYDIFLSLNHALPADQQVSRPVNQRIRIATGIALGPGSVWDHDVSIVTLSGSAPSIREDERVSWKQDDTTETTSTLVEDGKYELFVPKGPGQLFIGSGRKLDSGGFQGVASSGPSAAFDARGDRQIDLTYNIASLSGPAEVAGAGSLVVDRVSVRDGLGGRVAYAEPDHWGNIGIATTHGPLKLGVKMGNAAFDIVDPPPIIEGDTLISNLLPEMFLVHMPGDDELPVRALALSEVDGPAYARSHFVPSGSLPDPTDLSVTAFTGRYDVVAEARAQAAPRDLLLASDVLIDGDTELPGFPETVKIAARSSSVYRQLGWADRGDHGLSLISPRSQTTRPLWVEATKDAFIVDAFVGQYDVWVTKALETTQPSSEGPRLLHQKITRDTRVEENIELDVRMQLAEVDIEIRVNGEPTSDPEWAGILTMTHHERPSLATSLRVTPGEQSSLLLPLGVYDLAFAKQSWAGEGEIYYHPATPIAECVTVEGETER